ncbi:MAG: hypothetical protein A3C30_01745 [Candidatus Levybacteria bacterium RIFCSPHIGHO2_02_FULL_40_18]|nr:MAG: hypothetical protein A2869_00725 [Candidatus Levybacteria bacterium RIFCSPHIGHO2_01_FULL_40_58]OGH26715.1 MAG: hypothetical protein A3C30_01745 [Candidatus Levybacteria bacterium RIFCSPHIGHO2_02_FULL_40_18]OGH31650.1 MAG: hypothetical protein A3E43_01465 [Candidatus Levybacteria bacterium RIFCSPHIGHO2_12_FULL_40_31]OGH40550.1 MAG: hypothetical protein A2894_00015 [Candidatus Levybacteria bacterium RIFCSPLOWO2_01_FULL_40_64]OGH48726.1 MAG: hypothetical protein A3I54_03640 [Candidatus Lev
MRFKEILIAVLVTAFVVSLFFKITDDKVQKAPAAKGGTLSQSADHHSGSPQISTEVFGKLLDKEAPDFTLENYEGKKVNLKSLRGKSVILFFSEGLMCYPACWDQIAAFGKDQKLNNENTVTLTIVNDRRADWKSALKKMPELATAQVLFDTDRSASVAYGVLSLPSSMHRGQLAGHTYVVIDKEGIVRFVKDDPQMAIRNQELLGEVSKF